MEPQSGYPIGAAVEVLGDRWTLLILRDIIYSDRRYFRALLTGSEEGIASNILADRLKRLLDAGILTRGVAGRGQRARFSLTEAGIQTLPIIVAFAEWGREWGSEVDGEGRLGDTERRVGEQGTPGGDAASVTDFMDDLRVRHLGTTAH